MTADTPNRVNFFINTKPDKYGPGVEVHIGGTTVSEATLALAEFVGTESVDAIEKRVRDLCLGTQPAAKDPVDQAVNNVREQIPASDVQPDVMRCAHGPMRRREGDNDRGHWVGYFCPLPKERKNEQCKPVFK